MNVQDIRLNADGDVDITSGDFDLTPSDQTHIEHILRSNKGYWFEFPLVGVSIIERLKGSGSKQPLKQEIRRQLSLDNYAIRTLELNNDLTVKINAERKK